MYVRKTTVLANSEVLGVYVNGNNNVVKTTVFLKDMEDFGEMNRIYNTFFTTDCPARSAVEVARLPKDVRVEIEAIAAL